MLELQNKLNAKINPDWLNAGYAWHRAIMVEGIELLEHFGWKWWKKQTPNIAQAKIELVDIWHFALSMYLVLHNGDVDNAAAELKEDVSPLWTMRDTTTTTLIEVLVAAAARDGHFNAASFTSLMHDLGLSWSELYSTYVAKNVLNMFRQDHGYKEGTYEKDWGGVEDNVRLEQLMVAAPDATPGQLYEHLEAHYVKDCLWLSQ